MLNIIKSECYKVIHRRCTYVFLAVFMLGGFFINYLIKVALADSKRVTSVGNASLGIWIEMAVIMGWFLVYMIDQIVHSNESKTGVAKNSISFGSSRTKMYIGRYLTQLLMLVIAGILVIGSVMLGNLIFNGGASANVTTSFLQTMGTMTIFWIAAMSLAHALGMCLNSNTLGSLIYNIYFLLGANIIGQLWNAFPKNKIIEFIYHNEMNSFVLQCLTKNEVVKNVGMFCIIGGVYLAVSFGLGLYVYRRKEIK